MISLLSTAGNCGIGVAGEGREGVTSAVSQCRALIFCQYKSMQNIIENTPSSECTYMLMKLFTLFLTHCPQIVSQTVIILS